MIMRRNGFTVQEAVDYIYDVYKRSQRRHRKFVEGQLLALVSIPSAGKE